MKVAVFGSDGQLGRCFYDLQSGKSDHHYRFYNKTQMDISDPKAYRLLNNKEIDVMINCAAYTKVDLAE